MIKRAGSSLLRFGAGLIALALAIMSWVIMAEKLQGLFTSFPKPYFMCYWIHSWYAILYVFWKVWREFPCNLRCNSAGDGALSWKRALWSSGLIGFISMLSAYFWYLSLSRTSVPANTSIFQSVVAFVFILSVPLLREKVTLVKVVGVLFSLAGVVLIAVFSESKKDDKIVQTPLGYVYLVVSTLLFALLEVLFKKYASFKDDPASAWNGVRFVGLMGIHTIMWMWPPLIVLHFTRVETFEFPVLSDLWLIFFNALMDVIFNGSLFACIALTSPLFASVGTVTAIPVSVLVDFLINHETYGPLVYVGMVLIGIAFIGFCISEFIHIKMEGKDKLIANSTVQNSDTGLINSIKEEVEPNNDDITSSTESTPLLKTSNKNRYFKLFLKYLI